MYNFIGRTLEEKHRDNMAKKMPGLNPVFVNGRMTEKCCNTAPEAGSTGSLQVADLENYNGEGLFTAILKCFLGDFLNC